MELDLAFILAAIVFVCIVALFFYSDYRKKNSKQYGLALAKLSSVAGFAYFVSLLGLAVLLQSTLLVILGVVAGGIILILIDELWTYPVKEEAVNGCL